MKKSDIDFMKEAFAEAELALAHEDIPVGAVLVRDGQIIARAHNQREKDASPTAHAEMMVLALAGKASGHWNLSGCTLYVTLEPCAMCAGALVLARIEEVVYAASDAKGGAISLDLGLLQHAKLNHRVAHRQGPMAEECGKLLKDFFQKKRREKNMSGTKS